MRARRKPERGDRRGYSSAKKGALLFNSPWQETENALAGQGLGNAGDNPFRPVLQRQ
ncbi:MAG: hypothetical protein M2R46_05324 [Verrucomicrobia subdivision 3 bacterium]|nr:hypothetical protein [Limisphaerales bacterium]